MINYDEPLSRPPSEAESLIIQATLGCSHNRCTFCSMYKTKKYKVKSLDEISSDIESVKIYPGIRRVFLADGDALSLETSFLIKILRKLKDTFPKLRRISIYGNTGNILSKSDKELLLLKEAGLSIVYLGFETGSDILLKKIDKGITAEEHILGANRLKASGIDLSATLINGLGGKELSDEHVLKSAELINRTAPKYLSTLSLIIPPECRKRFESAFETGFSPQDDFGMMKEEKLLIQNIDTDKRIIFRSNHASNALALSGTLPAAAEDIIRKIDAALKGDVFIRPAWFRGL